MSTGEAAAWLLVVLLAAAFFWVYREAATGEARVVAECNDALRRCDGRPVIVLPCEYNNTFAAYFNKTEQFESGGGRR